MRRLIRDCGSVLAVAGLLAVSAAFAQDSSQKVKSKNKVAAAP